ncbi:MAG: hypothetical protein K6A38_08040 [Lachnospiraceae bacterium]|nr:hypothetical protein [Lachnospiraceae bacterium]
MNRKPLQKSIVIFLMILSVMAVLSGCSKTSDSVKNDDESVEETKKQDKDKKKKKKKKKDKEKDKDKEEAHETPDEDKGLFERSFDSGQVENNGGLFVRVGNRVYFRLYNKRSLEPVTYEDSFIDETDYDQPSLLEYFDLDENKVVEVCEVNATGPIYVTTDGICLQTYRDGAFSMILVDEDGNVDENYFNGTISKVSPDGRSFIAFEEDEDGDNVSVFYSNGEKVGKPSEEGDGFVGIGFAGDTVIGQVIDHNSFDRELFSYDYMGELTMLGKVDAYDMETYSLTPNIEELTPGEDGGYVTVSYRDGTADAVVAWAVYGFKNGKKDSVTLIDSGNTGKEYNYSYPKVSLGEDNELMISAHKAGDVYLSDGSYGDLMCHTGDGEDVEAYDMYIYDPGDYSMYKTLVEGAVCVDENAVFLIKANAYRCPEEDMGVNRAYELSGLSYEYIRFETEGEGKYEKNSYNWFSIGELYSAGWSKGEIEYDRLIGTWKMNSTVVEGSDYQDCSEDLFETRITFNEDGSAVLSNVDKATGNKAADDQILHEAEPSEDSSLDYAYYYETDDEQPMQVGVCYLSHGRLAIYVYYHYDGNSVGWYRGSFTKTE